MNHTGQRAVTAPGPLRAVLAAIEEGAPTLDAVARTTGLPREVVEAAVEHLVRVGRLSSQPLGTACAPGGCGGCPLATTGPGCSDAGPDRPGRPALVALSPRR